MECSIPFNLISLPSIFVAITMIHSMVSALRSHHLGHSFGILMSMDIFLNEIYYAIFLNEISEAM